MRIGYGVLVGVATAALFGCAPPEPPPTSAPSSLTEFRRVTSPAGNLHIVSIARDAWRDPPRAYPIEAAPSDSRTLSASVAMPTIMAARAPQGSLCTAKQTNSDGHTFNGSAREVAKTTLPSAPLETFGTVAALRADIAKKSDDLVMIDAGISTKCDEVRTPAERRMVSVVGYLYAMKKEGDNDYHLILGTKTCKKSDCFMTAEVSGIPRLTANRQELATARQHFETAIQQYVDDGNGATDGGYFRFDPPIRVQVRGPLFYDADHKIKTAPRAGTVGPAYARPSTSWEIHPVTAIDLEPSADEMPIAGVEFDHRKIYEAVRPLAH
jgi:hypothetical protein